MPPELVARVVIVVIVEHIAMDIRQGPGGSSSGARKKVSIGQNSGVNLNQNGLTDSNINLTNSLFDSSGSHANSKSAISNNADVNSNLANIPLSSSHKSKSDNPSSIKQNSKINLNQAGLGEGQQIVQTVM